eukprot:366223-Chlamydomonas_euryale.AAC.12
MKAGKRSLAADRPDRPLDDGSNPFEMLPPELLRSTLAMAGAWKPGNSRGFGRRLVSAVHVCRAWRDALQNSPTAMAKLLLHAEMGQAVRSVPAKSCVARASHGGKADVLKAMLEHPMFTVAFPDLSVFEKWASPGGRSKVPVFAPEVYIVLLSSTPGLNSAFGAAQTHFERAVNGGNADLVECLLRAPLLAVRADYDEGAGLTMAAMNGRTRVVELLLSATWHAAQADSGDGEALCAAAFTGHPGVVELLLNAPQHAARADCKDGEALMEAANGCRHLPTTPDGLAAVVELLLNAPQHPAHADCRNGEALILAARKGYTSVVELLLNAPHHAARADARDGEALLDAARNGHAEVVELLLNAPQHAAHANCREGEALITAARNGHAAVVELMLKAPQHPARADCRGGEALAAAANGGHKAVVELLNGAALRGPVPPSRASW